MKEHQKTRNLVQEIKNTLKMIDASFDFDLVQYIVQEYQHIYDKIIPEKQILNLLDGRSQMQDEEKLKRIHYIISLLLLSIKQIKTIMKTYGQNINTNRYDVSYNLKLKRLHLFDKETGWTINIVEDSSQEQKIDIHVKDDFLINDFKDSFKSFTNDLNEFIDDLNHMTKELIIESHPDIYLNIYLEQK